eukprot:765959-Hanusia_phi.AAC.2
MLQDLKKKVVSTAMKEAFINRDIPLAWLKAYDMLQRLERKVVNLKEVENIAESFEVPVAYVMNWFSFGLNLCR